MFRTPVAKAQTKAAASSASRRESTPSTLVARPFGGSAVEGAHLQQRAGGLTGNEHGDRQEQEAERLARGAPVASWDLSKIPVFSPDRPNGRQLGLLSTTSQMVTTQANLAVGRASDPLEHEADRMADRVVRMPSTVTSGSEVGAGSANTRDGVTAPVSVQEVVSAAGYPLDPGARAFFEPRFGSDFSHVRVHADSRAALTAKAVNARAYTVGSDIVFGEGQFDPATRSGQRLLAHELSRVVQQQAGQLALQRQPLVLPEDVISIRPTEKMPAEHISGSPGRGQWKTRVIETAHNISNRARINAVELAGQVESACEAFQLYADPKLKELEGEVTASDLAAGLGTAILTAVGGALAAKVGNAFGRQIATQISRQLAKGLSDRAKSLSPASKDIKDLRSAVGSIAMRARDRATVMEDAVGGTIDVRTKDIIDTANANMPLSPEQNDFLGPFYLAADDVVDAFLESYGIPSGASATGLQLDVYESLVEKFEEMLIWVHASFGEQIEMVTATKLGATKSTLSYKAGQVAKQARKTREEELKTTPSP